MDLTSSAYLKAMAIAPNEPSFKRKKVYAPASAVAGPSRDRAPSASVSGTSPYYLYYFLFFTIYFRPQRPNPQSLH